MKKNTYELAAVANSMSYWTLKVVLFLLMRFNLITSQVLLYVLLSNSVGSPIYSETMSDHGSEMEVNQ